MSSSLIMVLIHNLSLTVRAVAIYSASMLESATDTYRLLFQAIAAPPNIKTMPDVDRKLRYVRPISLVYLRYRITCLRACQCASLGFCINLERNLAQ